MTKEELKQEAEESFEQYKVTDEDYVVSPYSDDMGEKMLMYNDEYYAEETYLRLYTEGYLAGAEPREKRIAELEEQNTSLLTSVENLNKSVQELEQKLEQTEKDLADYQFNYPTIKELQKELDYQKQARSIAENAVVNLTKENTDLKCECRRCVYTDRLCILSDYGKDRNGICDHFKDVFDEVVELRENNKELAKALAVHCQDTQEVIDEYEKENAELKSENQKWKNEWQEQVQKATDEGYTRTLQTIQLSKAIEIIKTLADDLSMYSGNYQKELLEAKQFLNSEVEK